MLASVEIVMVARRGTGCRDYRRWPLPQIRPHSVDCVARGHAPSALVARGAIPTERREVRRSFMLQRLRGQAEDLPVRWFGQFFATHERMLWKLSDLPWDRIDRHQLDTGTVAAVQAAMLVESHNPVYASTLLGKFRLDYKMTNFLAVWTYEEFKHFAGLKTYLEATDSVPPAALQAELAATRAGDWLIPDHYTDIMMATYAMVQELVTGIFYKNFALRVKEP